MIHPFSFIDILKDIKCFHAAMKVYSREVIDDVIEILSLKLPTFYRTFTSCCRLLREILIEGHCFHFIEGCFIVLSYFKARIKEVTNEALLYEVCLMMLSMQ